MQDLTKEELKQLHRALSDSIAVHGWSEGRATLRAKIAELIYTKEENHNG